MANLKEMSKEERLDRFRHSAAHVMAEAVVEMFPDARVGIGPPIDTGFYYDFELPRTLTLDDLPRRSASTSRASSATSARGRTSSAPDRCRRSS